MKSAWMENLGSNCVADIMLQVRSMTGANNYSVGSCGLSVTDSPTELQTTELGTTQLSMTELGNSLADLWLDTTTEKTNFN
jgi:hypothetical protein